MLSTAVNNKRFGFAAEAQLLKYLREYTNAERLYLTGVEDEGDLVAEMDRDGWGSGVCIVQLKTFAMRTAKGEERPFSPAKLKGWLRDLDTQRAHYAAHRGLSEPPEGILVVKPKNWSWDDALVIRRLKDWVG